MSKSSLFSLFSIAALSLGLSISAGATTITTSAGPGSGLINFDPTSTGFTFSGNAGIVSGSVSGAYAAPAGDATNYAFVGTGGTATYTNAAGFNTFGLYWGSPDQYNTIKLVSAGGTEVYGNGGTALSFTPGFQGNPDKYVTFSGSTVWTSVIFTSATAAFEFDNVSASTAATPEPASIALLAGGLLAIGAGAIRRRKA